MQDNSPLSEQASPGPQTVQTHNAGLTGSVILQDVPAIEQASPRTEEKPQPGTLLQVTANETVRALEPNTEPNELEGVRTRRDLRLNVARELKRIFETDPNLTIEQKIKLADRIEKLTSGNKLRQPNRDKKSTGIFS